MPVNALRPGVMDHCAGSRSGEDMFRISRRCATHPIKHRGQGLLAAAALGAVLAGGNVTPASAQSVQRGLVLAQTHCAMCHALDRFGPSPLPIAPPFRDLHNRYPVESLEETLAEGIITGHPTMPEFKLDPGQVGDFIAYLKSLE
jgi:mono/diheme cytochrome c family protein